VGGETEVGREVTLRKRVGVFPVRKKKKREGR